MPARGVIAVLASAMPARGVIAVLAAVMPARALIAVLAAVLALAPAVHAEVYHWTDRDGVEHYTTTASRIPERYRAGVRVIDTPAPAVDQVPGPAGTVLSAGGGPIMAEAHLNGVPLTLVVDTGASRTVIAPAALQRAGVDLATARVIRIVGVTGSTEAREVVVPRLDVAGAQIGPLTVIAHDVPGLPAHGLLGRDVLDHFVLTVDAARGRATLHR